jgi:hypothetical protein
MKSKRYPLSKRFNVALSEKAYKNLRALNEKYRYGNNYLLTILLENFEQITNNESVEKVFADFQAEYDAPASGAMKKKN